MNDTKRLGRPRKFDTEEALMTAMNVFWTKGYDRTSMKDLTREMGISGPSLYSAFGDKRELYLKTIDLYSDVDACAPIVAFEAEPDLKKAVREFLTDVVTNSISNGDGPTGCFLASCVSTSVGEVEGVQERLIKAITDTDKRLTCRFDAEIEKGTLPVSFPSKQRAKLMFDMRQGYVFRSRAGWTAELLLQDLDDRVKMIITP